MTTQPNIEENTALRGIIIVDASSLQNMSAEIRPEAKKNSLTPERYLESLIFLSQHGYRIIIPEIVSIEIGCITAEGKNTETPFSLDKRNLHIINKLAGAIQPFLRNTALGNYPNIEMLTNTGPAEVDAYCNAISLAMNKDMGSGNGGHKRGPEIIRKGRKEMIARVHAQNKDDFGDKAILSIIDQGLAGTSGDTPVTVLTEDRELRDALEERALKRDHAGPPLLSSFTSRRFMQALANAGLEEAWGLHPVAEPYALPHMFMEDSNRTHRQANPAFVARSNIRPGTRWFDIVQNSRLQSGFYQLAEELKRAPASEAAPTGATVGGKRFGNRFAQYGSFGTRTAATKSSDDTPPFSS